MLQRLPFSHSGDVREACLYRAETSAFSVLAPCLASLTARTFLSSLLPVTRNKKKLEKLRSSRAGSDAVVSHLALSASHRLCLGAKTGKTSLWTPCNIFLSYLVIFSAGVWEWLAGILLESFALPNETPIAQGGRLPLMASCMFDDPGDRFEKAIWSTAHWPVGPDRGGGKGCIRLTTPQPTAAMTCHIASGCLQPRVGPLNVGPGAASLPGRPGKAQLLWYRMSYFTRVVRNGLASLQVRESLEAYVPRRRFVCWTRIQTAFVAMDSTPWSTDTALLFLCCRSLL